MRSSMPSRSLRASPWTAATGRRPPSTWISRLAVIDEQRMHDDGTSVLAFTDAARLALHRGTTKKRTRQLTEPMRSAPPVVQRRPADHRRAGPPAARQVCTWRWPTTRALATSCVRSTTSSSTARPSACSVDEVAELRRLVSPAASDRNDRWAAPDVRRVTLLPYLQTHLSFREIGERLFVSRNTISTQCGSIYRKLGVSSRNGAVEHARPAIGCSAGSRLHRPDWCSSASSVSYPSAIASVASPS